MDVGWGVEGVGGGGWGRTIAPPNYLYGYVPNQRAEVEILYSGASIFETFPREVYKIPKETTFLIISSYFTLFAVLYRCVGYETRISDFSVNNNNNNNNNNTFI